MVEKTAFRAYAASPEKQGVHENKREHLFSVTVPEGQEASLLLYRRGESEPCQEIRLDEKDRIGNCSAVCVEMDDKTDFEYCYRIGNRITADPYARSVRFVNNSATGKEEPRCSLNANFTARTRPLEIPYEDTVFYKLHVRGFTMDKSAGVKHPGTFEGVKEKIPYLKKLGVNALILMPCYEFRDFSAEERCYELDGGILVKEPDKNIRKNYWGYDSGLYFAPKEKYAAFGNPNREFAELVDALHDAGLECIPEFFFRPEADSRLVADVLRHWRIRFHVDGFHLVGSGNWIHALETDPLLARTKLLYTDFDTSSIYGGNAPGRRNLGVMNCYYQHMMRKFLKGDLDVNPEEIAFLQRRNEKDYAFINYFADQDGFTMADMVSYEEKHNDANGEMSRDGSNDNYTWNCGEEGPTRKTTIRNLRAQLVRNAFLLLATAQASPMIYAGDECENSQQGNNNAWCQDNKTGWVNWKKTRSAEALTDYVKAVLDFRKKHPVLHQRTPLRMTDYRGCGLPDLSYHSYAAWVNGSTVTKAGLGVLYCGEYAQREDGSKDDTLYFVYNMYWQEQSFALPTPPEGYSWRLVADTSLQKVFITGSGKKEMSASDDRLVSVSPRSIKILQAVPKKREQT